MGFTVCGFHRAGVLLCLGIPVQGQEQDAHSPSGMGPSTPRALSSRAKPRSKATIVPRADLKHQLWRSLHCQAGQCSTATSWDHQGEVGTAGWEQDELGRKEELQISGCSLCREWLRTGQLDLEMQVPQRCCLSGFADPRQLKIEASR